jgi:ATP-dependent Clp protease protease subunit
VIRREDLKPEQRELLERGIIDISDKVEGSLLPYVKDAIGLCIMQAEPVPLIVRITSPGGECTTGFGTYDLIRTYPGKTTGVALGTCSSMATVILQACDVRQCGRYTHFLAHNPKFNPTGVTEKNLADPKWAERELASLKRDRERIERIFAERSGQSIAYIRRLLAPDRPIHAEEALEHKLIDEII